TPGDPASVMKDPTALQSALDLAILKAVGEADVSAVVIGGGPLATVARELAAKSPVPLIEPIPAAVRLSFARLGLTCPA
ncbi:MAG: hydrogenase expression protein HupH, partial [Pseudomonadota bacterium]